MPVIRPEDIENDRYREINRFRRQIIYKRRRLREDDIRLAMQNTKSNKAAARFLGVHYLTYRAYAKKFKDEDGISLFDKHLNMAGKGIKKWPAIDHKKIPLQDILDGKYPNYVPTRMKWRLIQEGHLPEKCANCGFNHKRPVDNKVPLILNFIDNNIHNFKLENMEFLCYNCYFLLVGTPMNPYNVYKFARLIDYPNMSAVERRISEG